MSGIWRWVEALTVTNSGELVRQRLSGAVKFYEDVDDNLYEIVVFVDQHD